MKVTLTLKIKEKKKEDTSQDFLVNSLLKKSESKFTDFSVEGLPDKYSSLYLVDDCITINDKNIKKITSNNTDIIDLKILKNKNIFNVKVPVYKIYFKKTGSGSLKILHKDGRSRDFGIFLEAKKDTIKFGNNLNIGSKYEKFWDKLHVDILYINEDIDILTFVKMSLKKGSIPAIIFSKQKNTLKKIIEECIYYTQQSSTPLIIMIPLKDITEYYLYLSQFFNNKNVKFCILLKMQNMKHNIDCTRTLGHKKGLQILNKDAIEIADEIKKLNIKNKNNWLIGFNQNLSDSYNKDHFSIKFNNDIWLNYLFYILKITKEVCIEALIYNIPVGLLNKNKIKNHTNTSCDYEDGSVLFFFGGEFITHNLFYKENNWNDTSLVINEDSIEIKDHLDLCLQNNIKYLFFGSEMKTGTTSNYSPYSIGKVMDNYNLINRISNYKKKLF